MLCVLFIILNIFNMSFIKTTLDSIKSIANYLFLNKIILIFVVFVVFILLNFVFSEHGIINRIKLGLEQKEYKEKISLEIRKTDSLKNRIVTLSFDSLEIERIAREYYGMLKPKEKLYIYKNINKKDE